MTTRTHYDAPFPTWLRARMAERGLWTSDVGERAGVKRYTVYSWRNGIAQPFGPNVDSLAAVLGVSRGTITDLCALPKGAPS